MKKTLSAPFLTFVYKFIFSPVWIGGFALLPIGFFLDGKDDKWMFLLLWIAGSYAIYRYCIKLKVVKVDDKFVYISNYLKEISVPFTDIEEITDNIFINTHPVYIVFRRDTKFGRKIMFIPKGIYIFRHHPVVKELREKIRNYKLGRS